MAYQQHEEEWNNGLCSHCCGGDCSTCLASWFCSCFLYGRLSSRAKNFPRTEKADIEYANGSCCVWYATACFGFSWVPQMLRRQEIRQQFGIKGNGCNDCLAAFCCAPCSLAQMETELKDRAEKAKSAGLQQGYPVQAQGMVYGQQQQQQQPVAPEKQHMGHHQH
ncbi:PLAC8-domain-containing protein [Polychaeton citri CBS 116435]|uniref:PLAC8-domain-containing protein n=1 Tax=Polychaeton citri CBS 116435 TaxID=1314669 RepID=A0A9P4UMN9_9PEZI|nr:PLAC8-domain-containing protein [Polychaeton citri CBS 116435]